MAIKAETSFSLADQLFNRNTVDTFAQAIEDSWSEFNGVKFRKTVLKAFPDLELKQRIEYMADTLHLQLPRDFNAAAEILVKALPEPLDPNLTDDDFGHFIWAVPSQWVAKHGCTEDRLKRSLELLKEMTTRFTVESAIRPFLNTFPDESMRFIRDCAQDDNYHVRRLASEGIRPYLPWALRVRLPIDEVLEVLTILHGDATRYVTRSVANTLNDLSKDEPEKVLATLKGWHKQKAQGAAELDWMTRHALRTLVKTDNANALELLGYPSKPDFSISSVSVPDRVAAGDHLLWQGVVKSKTTQKLKIALRVHFLKANGSHSAKVFALKDVDARQEDITLSKKLPFKPLTTRVLYPGTHHIELVVNGVARGRRTFELVA